MNQTVSGFTATGLVGGETAAVLTGVTASRTEKNAGTYVTSASGTDGNYNLSFVDGSMVIAKAPLNITALNGIKQYDGTAHTGGYGVNIIGFVNNETLSVLSGALGYSGTSQGVISAGSYVISASGMTSANYDLNFLPGSLQITSGVMNSVVSTDPVQARVYLDGYKVSGLGTYVESSCNKVSLPHWPCISPKKLRNQNAD